MEKVFPKVSIMIPTYNRAHFLGEAIESALMQDYPNLEVIVSDNASTDGTCECIKKYLPDPRFRYFRNDENQGSSANYERLLYQYATGEYGKYLTDDDLLIDREHISKAVRIIEKHKVKAVFSAAVSRYEGIDSEGKNLSLGLPEAVPRQWWLDNICTIKFGLTYFPSCGSGTLFEIQRAKDLGAFRQGLYYNDYEFAVKCILLDEKTGYIKEPSYLERRHPGQDGRTSAYNAYRGTMIFQRIYEFGTGIGMDYETIDRIRLRGFICFTRSFLMHNWLNEHGKSFRSFSGFMRELGTIDRRLPSAIMRDPYCMVQFAIFNSRLHAALTRLVRDIRSSALISSLRRKG